MCQAYNDQPTLVRDICADDISILALSLVRFVAAGYTTGDVACWETAYDIAESALGDTDGPIFVAAMAGIMRAIRAERSEDWRFMPASCCRVTSAEEQLVRLFAAARAGEAGRLAQAARAITGVGEAPLRGGIRRRRSHGDARVVPRGAQIGIATAMETSLDAPGTAPLRQGSA
ncbi:hypothetical protein R1A27_32025 (plasmid) [Methylobacterium sp. NMS12]|uniref:hypothetical protein n=1 Tax=Methylobacterium sp. NMS12 TaxID=3079766 RepID=UPI003F881325